MRLPCLRAESSTGAARCRLSLLVAAFLIAAVAAPAAPVTGPIDDNDTVALQVNGEKATLQLTLARAPASSEGAVLRATNRDNYPFWSTPLTKQGNQWTAAIDQEGLQAILIVDRLVAEFPGAARDNEALQLVISRERFMPAFEGSAAIVGNAPLFFVPPEPPEKPEVPQPNVDRLRADSFAMMARVWDHQIAAHQSQFAAARSRAHGLFLDLKTSGRLPFKPEAVEQLAKSYEQLAQQEQQIAQARQQWRQTVQQFVQEWNAAHSGQPPLAVNFGEPAAS